MSSITCGIVDGGIHRPPRAKQGAIVSGQVADGQAEQSQRQHPGPHGGEHGEPLGRAEVPAEGDATTEATWLQQPAANRPRVAAAASNLRHMSG